MTTTSPEFEIYQAKMRVLEARQEIERFGSLIEQAVVDADPHAYGRYREMLTIWREREAQRKEQLVELLLRQPEAWQ